MKAIQWFRHRWVPDFCFWPGKALRSSGFSPDSYHGRFGILASLGLILSCCCIEQTGIGAKSLLSIFITPSYQIDSLLMAPPSRSPTPPSTRRLLQELKSTFSEPSPVLQLLAPISEAQILHWEAVMKGVPDTAYEGTSHQPCVCNGSGQLLCTRKQLMNVKSWSLEARYYRSPLISHTSSNNQIPHTYMPSERAFPGTRLSSHIMQHSQFCQLFYRKWLVKSFTHIIISKSDRRNLSRSPQRFLVARLQPYIYPRSHTSIAIRPCGG